jgi:acetyl esterase/lipase
MRVINWNTHRRDATLVAVLGLSTGGGVILLSLYAIGKITLEILRAHGAC